MYEKKILYSNTDDIIYLTFIVRVKNILTNALNDRKFLHVCTIYSYQIYTKKRGIYEVKQSPQNQVKPVTIVGKKACPK